jgi:hypothetical protein
MATWYSGVSRLFGSRARKGVRWSHDVQRLNAWVDNDSDSSRGHDLTFIMVGEKG